jgi:hypothetical protein
MKERLVTLRWLSGCHCRGGGPRRGSLLDTSSAARPGVWGLAPIKEKNGLVLVREDIAGVPYISDIAQEGHQSNAKVEYDIEQHLRLDLIWEATLDLLAGSQNHHSHECVYNISNARKQTVSTS